MTRLRGSCGAEISARCKGSMSAFRGPAAAAHRPMQKCSNQPAIRSSSHLHSHSSPLPSLSNSSSATREAGVTRRSHEPAGLSAGAGRCAFRSPAMLTVCAVRDRHVPDGPTRRAAVSSCIRTALQGVRRRRAANGPLERGRGERRGAAQRAGQVPVQPGINAAPMVEICAVPSQRVVVGRRARMHGRNRVSWPVA